MPNQYRSGRAQPVPLDASIIDAMLHRTKMNEIIPQLVDNARCRSRKIGTWLGKWLPHGMEYPFEVRLGNIAN